jgi:regulator of protease activity HflC (stomatin/prohibitin superfamily)
MFRSHVFHALGTGFLAAALAGFAASDLAIRALGLSCLLVATGFFCEGLIVQVRSRGAAWVAPSRAMVYPQLPRRAPLDRVVIALRDARQRFDTIDWTGDWAPGALALAGGLLVVWLGVDLLRTPGIVESRPSGVSSGILLAATIPCLLLQRWLSRLPPHAGPGPESLVRLPLTATLLLGAATLFASLGYLWASVAVLPVLAFTCVAAVEIVLRACAQLFLPLPVFAERRAPALPWTLTLLRLGLPRFAQASAWLRSAYGVDLSQSWVLAFALRALAPVGAALLLLAWLSTGVTILRIDERAVVERMGVPAGVIGPGLHVHLPWPWERVRPVELGVVHEMPIVFSARPGGRVLAELASAGESDAAASMDAEAIPEPIADRLWDGSHPGEASYLIASSSGGREGFQIVNVDLRVVFRVPDSAADALASVYGSSDAVSLIRASAGRLLVSHFATSTLDDLLGENRGAFVERFRADLQKQVEAFHAGIAIIGVVVEAIHPPPGAASAYHNVQASGIRADAMRFQSHARAFALRGAAQQDALRTVNASKAAAGEQVSVAEATKTSFEANTRSLRAGPDVFVFETWLAHLGPDLARAHLTIVDHRIDGAQATLDLRSYAPGSTGGSP